MQLNKGQLVALDHFRDWFGSTRSNPMALIGAAGTGKTTLVAEILQLVDGPVALAATTGKAALRLKEITKRGTSTLHKLLYQPPLVDEKKQTPTFEGIQDAPEVSLLIIDEASMISPKVYEDLKNWVSTGTRVLLVGDGFQLPPVLDKDEQKTHDESYSVFSEPDLEVAELDEVMRSDGGVIDAVTLIRRDGELPKKTTAGYEFAIARGLVAIERWGGMRDSAMLITWRNAVRMAFNDHVRKMDGRTQKLPEPGEPLLFRRNGYGRLNGEIAPIDSWKDAMKLGPMMLRLGKFSPTAENPATFEVPMIFGDMSGQMPYLPPDDWRSYLRDKREMRLRHDPLPMTWGYCLTGHLAQGSEANEAIVYLDGSDMTNRAFVQQSRLPGGKSVPFWCRWLYTALSRARTKATLIVGM